MKNYEKDLNKPLEQMTTKELQLMRVAIEAHNLVEDLIKSTGSLFKATDAFLAMASEATPILRSAVIIELQYLNEKEMMKNKGLTIDDKSFDKSFVERERDREAARNNQETQR